MYNNLVVISEGRLKEILKGANGHAMVEAVYHNEDETSDVMTSELINCRHNRIIYRTIQELAEKWSLQIKQGNVRVILGVVEGEHYQEYRVATA